MSPIYNQGSFVAAARTPTVGSQCPLDAPYMPIAVESKPIPRAEPSHMPKRKKRDLGPWKALRMCTFERNPNLFINPLKSENVLPTS